METLLSSAKKKWGLFSGTAIRRYFSNDNVRGPSAAKETREEVSGVVVQDSSNGCDSPRSLKTKTSKSSLSLSSTVGKTTPYLTTALIPPPPQLLRERPEISRPLYKFGLEYCEGAARKQMDFLLQRTRGDPPPSDNIQYPIKPRLPFRYSYARTDADSSFETCSEDSSYEDEDFDEYDTCQSQWSIDSKPAVDDDVKYWKYVGRSLSEWDNTVCQFEEFVRTRKMMGGVARVEDVGVPFLVAEIPPRALAG
jgi:hypothetical protein